ncbi:hypothetical protein HN51_023255 [Arachis hypogaea]|uniref:RING-type domain-containing protein n=1 Tax=Arachis hypogaea TaxID=3818 RepID=A0A445E5Z9_ARAHY|nr:RING-H2 finger protein ATL63 [Arachis hypogaea]QHO54674.1 E3 ubiquitin-protein ligase [Arachis hypogaea]RYR70880.1 hypothetical protein Ahy_A02g005182 [Arachis hypogaea]
MGSSGTNLVTTIIGFGLSATFIVFVCTRIICGRIQRYIASSSSSSSRTIYEFQSRPDIERGEHVIVEGVPAFVSAIPTLKFNQEAFSSVECTQCVICLADYKEQELLRMIPKCGHCFHVSCIDMWLRKQSTCPVCRLPLRNALEQKNVTSLAFTISHHHSLDEEYNTSLQRNISSDDERPVVDSNSSNTSLPISVGEPDIRP